MLRPSAVSMWQRAWRVMRISLERGPSGRLFAVAYGYGPNLDLCERLLRQDAPNLVSGTTILVVPVDHTRELLLSYPC